MDFSQDFTYASITESFGRHVTPITGIRNEFTEKLKRHFTFAPPVGDVCTSGAFFGRPIFY
jgi:hypothetical protein